MRHRFREQDAEAREGSPTLRRALFAAAGSGARVPGIPDTCGQCHRRRGLALWLWLRGLERARGREVSKTRLEGQEEDSWTTAAAP